jgi:hypothetical protein
MCTPEGSGCALAAPGGAFAGVADALQAGRACGRWCRLAEELPEDCGGPWRDVVVGEELFAYLNCGCG